MTIARDTLRWNGWGRLGESMGFSRARELYLREVLARRLGCRLTPAATPVALESVRLTPTKLAQSTLSALRSACGEGGVRTSAFERITHALGKSLPDLLRLRRGEIGAAPEVVVYPPDEGAVAAVLRVAQEARLAVVTFGGGTSVVGGVEARAAPGQAGVLVLDTTRLDGLVRIDPVSATATFQAGIDGPALEAALAARGRTLGHFPQSFEHSTLGGWIATRSSGQLSNAYGGIEDLVVSMRVVTPEGVLRTVSVPRSAAGPDLNTLLLGSEGTLGVIVEGTLRTSPLPPVHDERGMLFRSFAESVAGVRDVVQHGIALSLLRVSDATETEFAQLLRRDPVRRLDLVAAALGAASRVGYGPGRSVVLYGADGANRGEAARRVVGARACLRAHHGLPLGRTPGRAWRRERFRTPYLRDWLLGFGVAVDTLETSVAWSSVEAAHAAVIRALEDAMQAHAGAGVAMGHLSHSYPDGACLYFTILYPIDPARDLVQWSAIKREATDAVLEAGGTLTHHHGVGTDHAAWMPAEKGVLGMRALHALKNAMDPSGIMNPGKLL
ncbi:MAG TPA: FAD-binding oxidoreductase [Myxococcota bacterium]|nr:FAD-binding oxidoreductase [Myxococcota bacterium]